MSRKFVDLLLSLYLLPLRLSTRLALYVKGRIFRFDEHYIVTLDVIKRYFPNSRGIIVDIGAYDGDSTEYFAKSLPQNRIYAFEPNPKVFEKGRNATRKYQNVEFLCVALSDSKGVQSLFVTDNLVSSSLHPGIDNSEFAVDHAVNVNTDTLDTYFSNADDILLLKLDVQGGELNILKAGKNVLQRTKLILTEVSIVNFYQGGCMYYEVDSLLRESGFVIHTMIANYNNEGTKYFDILYIRMHAPSLQ